MAFFPLSYKCSLRRKQIAESRSGQQEAEWVEVQTPRCLYLEVSGNKQAQSRQEFQGIYAFYAEPSCIIDEGDRVYDILNKFGEVVEPGPLEVLSVSRTPGPFGKIHHVTCKLRGVS